MNCQCTTAAFTVSRNRGLRDHWPTRPGDSALYAISVRQLAPLHSGFLHTAPRGAALAVG